MGGGGGGGGEWGRIGEDSGGDTSKSISRSQCSALVRPWMWFTAGIRIVVGEPKCLETGSRIGEHR